jgi:rhodanese-related sulfurtransferase
MKLFFNILILLTAFSASAKESSDVIVLDVRTNEEYVQGHAKSAVNLDVTKPDFDEKLAKMDKKNEYFVYCQKGGRASAAVEKMKKMGFTHVTNVQTVENAKKRFGQ